MSTDPGLLFGSDISHYWDPDNGRMLVKVQDTDETWCSEDGGLTYFLYYEPGGVTSSLVEAVDEKG